MKSYFLLILLIITALAFGVWWAIFSYRDCLRVEHSKTYCIVRSL